MASKLNLAQEFARSYKRFTFDNLRQIYSAQREDWKIIEDYPEHFQEADQNIKPFLRDEACYTNYRDPLVPIPLFEHREYYTNLLCCDITPLEVIEFIADGGPRDNCPVCGKDRRQNLKRDSKGGIIGIQIVLTLEKPPVYKHRGRKLADTQVDHPYIIIYDWNTSFPPGIDHEIDRKIEQKKIARGEDIYQVNSKDDLENFPEEHFLQGTYPLSSTSTAARTLEGR